MTTESGFLFITSLVLMCLFYYFRCRTIVSSYFFGFRRRENMDSVMKGLMGQSPVPRILELEPPLMWFCWNSDIWSQWSPSAGMHQAVNEATGE